MGFRARPAAERKARRKSTVEKYRLTNPNYRNARLRYLYKITSTEYDAMLVRQQGVCAICREPERLVDPRAGRVRQLSVDHHHQTGTVRGLLCASCNKGIGNLKDSPEVLRAAASYLEAICERR